MSREKREVILVANIDYGYDENGHKICKTIKEGDYVGKESPVSKLVNDAKSIITDQLPADLADIFGIHAKIRFIDTRYDSVNIFFGVVLSGITLLANYKNFYDSMQLIKEHCQFLINGLLHNKYTRDLTASVSIDYPVLNDPRDMYFPRGLHKFFGFRHFPPEIAEDFLEFSHHYGIQGKSRDAFFWFLLSLCIILLIIVGVLVYAAVVKTYFP